jgi:hypothetical protein
MAHTQAIDEAAPAGTDSASGGAAELRNLKRDLRQRMELEHYWNDALTGDQEDGKHINITQGGTGVIANKELIKSEDLSLTGSNAQSAIDQAGTWNTTGTPSFWKGSVTDTASNAASRFISWLVGGDEKFAVKKDGDLSVIKNIAYAWPSAQASAAGQVLSNDSSGNLSWADASSGKVSQVESMHYTAQVASTSATMATTNVTDVITLSATSSKCLVIACMTGIMAQGATSVGLRVRRAIAAGATTTVPGAGSYEVNAAWSNDAGSVDAAGSTITFLDDPSSTAALTYTIEFANTDATGVCYVLQGNARASITLMEITA